MKDMNATLKDLRRPPLLIRAARIGVAEYRRAVHLPRHLGQSPLPGSGEALMRLMEIEAEMDHQRQARAAGYSPARHVEILIAMMGEARLLRAAPRPVS